MGILDKFIDAIGADPANCVLVVGSGLSKQGVRAGGKGLPDWDELMRLMVHDLDESKRCPAAAIAQFRTWLTEDPPRYLDIADAFRKAYTHDLDGYERFLRRHLRPDDLADSQLHRLILGIGFKGIVSYNFDLIFEKQSDRLDKIVYPDLLEQIGHFRRKGYFAKIHGCIDRPATQLVLTGNSFHELSSNPNYTRLFEAIFLANWVLCVGFSLRDPDFQSILDKSQRVLGHPLPACACAHARALRASLRRLVEQGRGHSPLHRSFRSEYVFPAVGRAMRDAARKAAPGWERRIISEA
jgi:SIR2-like domain